MNYINYESIILNGSNDTNQQTSVYSGKQKKNLLFIISMISVKMRFLRLNFSCVIS